MTQGMRTQARASDKPIPSLPEDVRRQFAGIVFRAALLAIGVLAVDLATSHLPFGLVFPDGVGGPERKDVVTNTLKVLSVVPALLLALTSLAVTGLSQYGNPALLLLYRWHRIGSWERIVLLSGRTNPLYRSLVFSIAVVGSLSLLALSARTGWSQNYLPALALVLLLTVLMVMSVLSLLLWIVALRRLSDLVQHTFLTGFDVLTYVGQLKKDKVRLRGVRQGVDPTLVAARYEEQDEIKRSIKALTEIAIRSLEHRERIAAREATAALERLDQLASDTKLPIGWDNFYGCDGPQKDWLQVDLVDAIESVLLAAAELHYFSVACDCAKRLQEIGCRVTHAEWPGRNEVIKRVLLAYEYTIDECVFTSEYDLRDLLLGGLRSVLSSISCGSELWKEAVHDSLRDRIVGMLLRSVVVDDLVSLRAAQACLIGIADDHSFAPDQISDAVDAITDAAFNLGAIAFASRVYGTAAVLIDFAAVYYDKNGDRFSSQMKSHWESRAYQLPAIPKYATPDYFRLFLIVAAARSLAIKQPGWSKEAIWMTRNYGTSKLTDWRKRAEVTIRRMSSKVAYPRNEVDDWVRALNKLEPNLIRRMVRNTRLFG